MRCIGVFYSKPFENFIAPHTTEYRYSNSNFFYSAATYDSSANLQWLETPKQLTVNENSNTENFANLKPLARKLLDLSSLEISLQGSDWVAKCLTASESIPPNPTRCCSTPPRCSRSSPRWRCPGSKKLPMGQKDLPDNPAHFHNTRSSWCLRVKDSLATQEHQSFNVAQSTCQRLKDLPDNPAHFHKTRSSWCLRVKDSLGTQEQQSFNVAQKYLPTTEVPKTHYRTCLSLVTVL